MVDYLDIIARGYSGEWMAEEDWDLEKVALTTRRLVREHGLAWEKDHVITDDPSLADAVFRAGFELAACTGVYQRSTERVIRFSEEELADGLQAMPQTLVVGEGEDARTLYSRGICDERLPLIWGGPPGTPFPERLFLANTISYALGRIRSYPDIERTIGAFYGGLRGQNPMPATGEDGLEVVRLMETIQAMAETAPTTDPSGRETARA